MLGDIFIWAFKSGYATDVLLLEEKQEARLK
jgi:hypothetical protein